MARAQGARSQLTAAFESVYGTAPGGNYTRLPFATSSLGAEQPLLASELLGYGRDPIAPVKDAVTVDGDISIPIDPEAFGIWLKAAFGAPVSTNTAAAGGILFAGNPAPGDTITLGGVVWTFVASGASGNETDIDGTLADTLAALVSDLLGSLDPVIGQAGYTVSGGDTLKITYGRNGTAGNHFALAASDATPSGPRLTGGGCSHEFQSGGWSLPSLSLEIGMPEVPRFALYTGVMVDQLSWSMAHSGLLTATAQLVAQGETVTSTTQAGAPVDLPVMRFGHFNGAIKRNGANLGNIVSADITYANNLDRIETIRADGMIDGADPSVAALTGSLTARFADTALIDQALAGDACELEFGYALPTGEALTVTAHAVYLPRPRLSIEGPQGVQAAFDWQAARDPVLGRMATVTLVNNTGSL